LSTRFFCAEYLSNGGRSGNEIWHKGSLGVEDDAQMSNTRIAHTQHARYHTPRWKIRGAQRLGTSSSQMYDWRHIGDIIMSWQRSVTSRKLLLRTSVMTSHVTCFLIYTCQPYGLWPFSWPYCWLVTTPSVYVFKIWASTCGEAIVTKMIRWN